MLERGSVQPPLSAAGHGGQDPTSFVVYLQLCDHKRTNEVKLRVRELPSFLLSV